MPFFISCDRTCICRRISKMDENTRKVILRDSVSMFGREEKFKKFDISNKNFKESQKMDEINFFTTILCNVNVFSLLYKTIFNIIY